MPSTEVFLAFLAAAAVFAYMPGPAMLYTTAQTIARGRPAGLTAALGIHLGGYVHVIAATTGLSVLFHAVPVLYTLLKIAGAGYLVWLGLGLPRQAARCDVALSARDARSARGAFVQSMIVEILNPKTAIFFLAFLPQFTDPGAALPIWAQLLVLGTIVNVLFSSADLVCVVLAGSISAALRRSRRARRLAQLIGGALLVGLGVRLAAQRT